MSGIIGGKEVSNEEWLAHCADQKFGKYSTNGKAKPKAKSKGKKKAEPEAPPADTPAVEE